MKRSVRRRLIMVGLALLAFGVASLAVEPPPQPQWYRLDVSTVEGDGQVQLDPEGTPGVPGVYWYWSLAVDVTLTAVPDSGWLFKEWRVGETGQDSAETTEHITTVSLTPAASDWTVVAVFEEDTVDAHTITAVAGDGGSIEPDGEEEVPDGEDKTFTITPNPGYEILDVVVDEASVYDALDFLNGSATYAFTNVTGDHTIEASFRTIDAVTHTIMALVNAGGTINPLGTVLVDTGDTQTFSITPDVGYAIANVDVDGDSAYQDLQFDNGAAAYTFADVSGDHSIEVWFYKPGQSPPVGSGWHLLSVPIVPADDSPESVFASVIDTGQILDLYEWIPDSSYHEPTAIDPGRGYWLHQYLEEEITIEVSGPRPSGVHAVDLETAGWQLVSTPKWPVGWQQITFDDGAETRTVTQAIDAGWIEPYAFSFDAVAGDYVPIELPDTVAAMDPWTGYWLKTRTSGLTMRVPLDEPYEPQGNAQQVLLQASSLTMDAVPAHLRPPAPPVVSPGGSRLTAMSYPNPVGGGQATFRVTGLPVSEVRVTVLDIGGRTVWQSAGAGNQLSWSLVDKAGKAVANGVYLYFMEAKVGDQWLATRVDRLLIVR